MLAFKRCSTCRAVQQGAMLFLCMKKVSNCCFSHPTSISTRMSHTCAAALITCFSFMHPQVRRNTPKITLPMVLELIEAQEWGPSTPKIPYTAAKERLAHITAAKAVAMALTPGLDPIKVSVIHMWHVTVSVSPRDSSRPMLGPQTPPGLCLGSQK